MPAFDLSQSIQLAEARLARRARPGARRRRSDAGASRLPPGVFAALTRVFHVQEKPAMRAVLRELADVCERSGERMPSRATVYRFMSQCEPHIYQIADLPDSVRSTLYNLDPEGTVPGHQLAFYAFNYGDVRAISYAAGLPWLDLYQASGLRGWHPLSRGLLRAVMAWRKI